MKVAIIGSRTFANLTKVRDYVNQLPSDTIVISGGARGVDTVAETTAKARGLQTIVYLPDWRRGKSAGMERNTQIVADADKVVAFWDGNSNGTRDSIKKARSMGKEVVIIYEE
jgi:predicted Rossmann fold nucleotide-binding protein DprA/Smf involved in DNA uptake